MMTLIQRAIQIPNTVTFQDYFQQGNGIFTPLGGEMGNGYRSYRDSLVDTPAGTDAELYTKSTNILQTQHTYFIEELTTATCFGF